MSEQFKKLNVVLPVHVFTALEEIAENEGVSVEEYVFSTLTFHAAVRPVHESSMLDDFRVFSSDQSKTKYQS